MESEMIERMRTTEKRFPMKSPGPDRISTGRLWQPTCAVLRLSVVALAVLFALALSAAESEKKATSPTYISLGAVPENLRVALFKHGDRLAKQGRERVTQSGVVTRTNSGSVAFQLVRELPVSIRYQEQGSGTLVFNGSQYAKGAATSVDRASADVIETLAYDTPERFFSLVARGVAMRKLGSRFQIVGSGGVRAVNAAYDIYAAVDTVQQTAGVAKAS
jgi:hypothetical protein